MAEENSALAEAIITKRSTETSLVPFNFSRKLHPGDTISGVSSVVSTTGLTVANQGFSGAVVNVQLVGGRNRTRFEVANGVVTAESGHTLAQGDRVVFRPDEDSDPPESATPDVTHWVASVTGDVITLASEASLTPALALEDGDGFLVTEYLVTVTVTTGLGETLEGIGRVRIQ